MCTQRQILKPRFLSPRPCRIKAFNTASWQRKCQRQLLVSLLAGVWIFQKSLNYKSLSTGCAGIHIPIIHWAATWWEARWHEARVVVLSSGAPCEIGHRGCSWEASQESNRGTGPVHSSQPCGLWHGIRQSSRMSSLDQDHESPSTSSDVQEAVTDSLTTKHCSKKIWSMTVPTGMRQAHWEPILLLKWRCSHT